VASTKTLGVRITGDASGAQEALRSTGAAADDFEKKWSTTGKKLADVGGKMTLGLTLPIVALGAVAIKSASDQAESLSKSNTIFEENGKAIEKWASGAARDFGQSKTQALESAASFGNMFRQLGVGIPVATKMSTKMVELASDFASFHNADITEVLIAQQAAFRGEYDALQRFVPTINAAAVEQKALAMTSKESTSELTAQDKALAVYKLMMEGAGKAAGDFDRTQGGAANQARILKAEFQDTAAKLGSLLIPMFTKLVGVGSSVLGWISELPPGVQTAGLAFAGFAAALGPVLSVVGNLMKVAPHLVKFIGSIGNAAILMAPKIGGAVEALKAMSGAQVAGLGAAGLLAGGLVMLGMHLANQESDWDRAREAAKKWGDQLKSAAKASGDQLGFLRDQMRLLNTEIRMKSEAGEVDWQTAQKLKAKHDELGGSIDAVKQQQKEAAAAERERTAALKEVAAGTTDVTTTSVDARDAIMEMQNAVLAASGGELGYRAALFQREEALTDLNVAIFAHGAESIEAQKAQLALEQAELQVANAAVGQTASMDELKRKIQETDGGAQGLIAQLEREKQLHPEAAAAIQQQIDKVVLLGLSMLNIPPVVYTNFVMDTAQAEANLRRLFDLTQRVVDAAGAVPQGNPEDIFRAAGGPVMKGRAYIVGEHRPELFVPNSSGYIQPSVPAMAGGGGGAQTVVIPVSIDGREVARAVWREDDERDRRRGR
jgi:hypothetical protein